VTSPLAITGSAESSKAKCSAIIQLFFDRQKYRKRIESGQRYESLGPIILLDSSYSSYTNEKFVKKDLAQTAAEEIYMRLMLYFSKGS
jgi:hypothetical protein